jgi:hypothetical protein
MWEYVAEQMNTPGNTHHVDYWKDKWLENHGFEAGSIVNACFFCQYDVPHGYDCQNCPGKLVDIEFGCQEPYYAYDTYPSRFLAEVKRLNSIRLENNKLFECARAAHYNDTACEKFPDNFPSECGGCVWCKLKVGDE